MTEKKRKLKSKIQFDIITIFPKIFSAQGRSASGGDSSCYFDYSIVKRAREKGLIKIRAHNLRDYTSDKHKTVDDKPYGGGPGMVMKIEPIYKAVLALKKSKVILFSPKGKRFDQKMAKRFSKLDRLIMICGRYEGVDERVAKYIADEEVSIGDYVVTGGEIPTMIVVDAVTRLIPGVIAIESLKEESFSLKDIKQARETKYEYPQYTRPKEFLPRSPRFGKAGGKAGRGWKTPKILLSGDHKKIEEWRKKH